MVLPHPRMTRHPSDPPATAFPTIRIEEQCFATLAWTSQKELESSAAHANRLVAPGLFCPSCCPTTRGCPAARDFASTRLASRLLRPCHTLPEIAMDPKDLTLEVLKEIRQELRETRTEMKTEIGGLKEENSSDQPSCRYPV
jgi:hypothetical protein